MSKLDHEEITNPANESDDLARALAMSKLEHEARLAPEKSETTTKESETATKESNPMPRRPPRRFYFFPIGTRRPPRNPRVWRRKATMPWARWSILQKTSEAWCQRLDRPPT